MGLNANLTFLPSVLAAACALLSTLGLLHAAASAVETVTEQWDIGRRFVDDASYVEHVLRQFRPADPAIIFLGGSVTREGVAEDATMMDALTARTGRAFTTRNLAFSSFSPAESLAIIDTLDVPPGSVVILQLGWQNLTESREDVEVFVRRPRIALLEWDSALEVVSPMTRVEVALTPALIRHAAVIANYLDQRGCAWYRLAQAVERERCTQVRSVIRSFYSVGTRMNDADKRASAAVAHAELVPRARANSIFAEGMYNRFIDRAVQRGFLPVLLMFPRDASETSLMEQHGMDLLEQQIAERLGARVAMIDMRHIDTLVADDFADPLHLLNSGRKKILPALAGQLVGIIQHHQRTQVHE